MQLTYAIIDAINIIYAINIWFISYAPFTMQKV